MNSTVADADTRDAATVGVSGSGSSSELQAATANNIKASPKIKYELSFSGNNRKNYDLPTEYMNTRFVDNSQ
jgi:hypothetical protein